MRRPPMNAYPHLTPAQRDEVDALGQPQELSAWLALICTDPGQQWTQRLDECASCAERGWACMEPVAGRATCEGCYLLGDTCADAFDPFSSDSDAGSVKGDPVMASNSTSNSNSNLDSNSVFDSNSDSGSNSDSDSNDEDDHNEDDELDSSDGEGDVEGKVEQAPPDEPAGREDLTTEASDMHAVEQTLLWGGFAPPSQQTITKYSTYTPAVVEAVVAASRPQIHGLNRLFFGLDTYQPVGTWEVASVLVLPPEGGEGWAVAFVDHRRHEGRVIAAAPPAEPAGGADGSLESRLNALPAAERVGPFRRIPPGGIPALRERHGGLWAAAIALWLTKYAWAPSRTAARSFPFLKVNMTRARVEHDLVLRGQRLRATAISCRVPVGMRPKAPKAAKRPQASGVPGAPGTPHGAEGQTRREQAGAEAKAAAKAARAAAHEARVREAREAKAQRKRENEERERARAEEGRARKQAKQAAWEEKNRKNKERARRIGAEMAASTPVKTHTPVKAEPATPQHDAQAWLTQQAKEALKRKVKESIKKEPGSAKRAKVDTAVAVKQEP